MLRKNEGVMCGPILPGNGGWYRTVEAPPFFTGAFTYPALGITVKLESLAVSIEQVYKDLEIQNKTVGHQGMAMNKIALIKKTLEEIIDDIKG